MQRSGKVVIVAHCLLNANSRARTIATWAGVHPVVRELADRGCGLLQAPCPEMPLGGCDRATATIEDYDTPQYRRTCDDLAMDLTRSAEEYLRCGYTVGPFIGVDGSPSCGVYQTTSAHGREGGMGVFVRALDARLSPLGIEFTAIDKRDPEASASKALAIVDELHEEHGGPRRPGRAEPDGSVDGSESS